MLALLEQHGLHPAADPGHVLEREEVLPGQTWVPVVVPDDEAARARTLLSRQPGGHVTDLRPSKLALVLAAATLLALCLFTRGISGPASGLTVAVSVVLLGAVITVLRRSEPRTSEQ